MNEQDLINLFEQALKIQGINNKAIFKQTFPNDDTQMDIEFIMNKIYYRLEAKHTTDSRVKSQNALNVFGSLLKGINLKCINNKDDLKINYGILISKSLEKQYKDYWNKIGTSNWNKFGESFKIDKVFLYADNKFECVDWQDFIN